MTQWEYCEVDFNGQITLFWHYDEVGSYIDNPSKHARLGIVLAQLGHEGWEIISTWWRSNSQVTYMLKRPCPDEWTESDRIRVNEQYRKNHPRDFKHKPAKQQQY